MPKQKIRTHPDWQEIEAAARKVIEETIASLPEPVRLEAEAVPCELLQWSDDGESLGYFSGFEPDHLSESGVISLFLGEIFDYCRAHRLSFEDELRTTYLHELGHHLGWDEDDLEARGL